MSKHNPDKGVSPDNNPIPRVGDISEMLTPAGQILSNYLENCSPKERSLSLNNQSVEEFISLRVKAYNEEKSDAIAAGVSYTMACEQANLVLLAGLEDITEQESGQYQQGEAGSND